VRALLAASLFFFVVTFAGANVVEARARCPAGQYYRPSQDRCVSRQEFQRMLERFGPLRSPRERRRAPIQPTENAEAKSKSVVRKPAESSAITSKPEEAPRIARPPPPESLLLELLPPNVQLWEKQYPTQWN
jgi:hypothetical protein